MLCYVSLLHWRGEVKMAAGSWRTMSMRDILADIRKMPNIDAQCKRKLKDGVVSHYLLMSKKCFFNSLIIF